MSSHMRGRQFQSPKLPSDDTASINSWLERLQSHWPACNDSPTELHRRKRQRRCSSTHENEAMPNNRDNESVASRSSASLSALQGRQILQPTPPSSRARSSSPAKKIRRLLELATPSIKFVDPSSVMPESVRRVKNLLAARKEGYIPRDLEKHFKLDAPNELDDIEPTDFYESNSLSDNLWDQVHAIYVQAAQCTRWQKDENEWVEICRNVLRAAGMKVNGSKLDVISVQTQQIEPLYLSKFNTSQIQTPSKRADLAFAVNPQHPEIEGLLDTFWTTYPDSTLSHLTDAYARQLPILCGIEVKTVSGDGSEALTQLGMWCAAALAKHKALLGGIRAGLDDRDNELPPFLGWTVIGHTWSLYISWQAIDAEQNISVIGPWSVLTASTVSHQDILKLLKLIRRVVEWIEEEQLAWFKKVILTAMP